MYTIHYPKNVIKKHISILPLKIKKIVKQVIEERLTIDPIGNGKPLKYMLKGYRSCRVGDYRIIYKIEQKRNEIIIAAIQHRKEVHEHLKEDA